MYLRTIFLTCIIVTFSAFQTFAQEYVTPFSQFSVGLKASSLGYGLEVASPLSSKFVLRAGLNLTSGLKSDYINVALPDDDNDLYDAFGYVPDYRAKLGMNFTHANVLVDFHPAGIFHITAGFYVGQSKFALQGYMADRNNNNEQAVLKPGYDWPSVDLGDQTLVLTDGRANLDLQLGGIVKPYFGLGVGRSIAKDNRLSFKFELGAIYLGAYTLKQDGKILDLSKSTNADVMDTHDILKQIIAYPVINFQLSWRIL